MLKKLKRAVLGANIALVDRGLVIGTWGNASAIDRERGLIVIKPSGVPYHAMTTSDMVTLNLDGEVVEGDLQPSSDTPTHLVLYRAFPEIGGIVHTHSHHATCWAQACKPIPCFGTTHADYFHGEIPLTAPLQPDDMDRYEHRTGEVIVERLQGMDPLHYPGVLVANHAPFAWGASVEDALEAATAIEEIARMALHTLQITPDQAPIPQHILDKHFHRKHGENAYYGQQ